jgi:hypothetical protein
MAQIPLAAQLLAGGTPRELQKLLIGVILHMQHEEDEAIIVTEADLVGAEGYTLVTTVIPEDGATVLTVKQK